jgi:O-antigen ligase
VSNLAINKRVFQATSIIGPLMTLAISPSTNFDPVNLIKLLFLSTISFFLLGIFLSEFKLFVTKIGFPLLYTSGLFILFLLLSLMFSGAPRSQQFWGVFGRSTGILTYVGLLICMLAAAYLQNYLNYRAIIHRLIFCSLVVSFYSLIQIVKLDPIGWSRYETFATLGNTNFLSSFLGITTLLLLVFCFDSYYKSLIRVMMALLSVINTFIILSTESIQGVMILIAGFGIALYFVLRNISNSKFLRVVYLCSGLLGFAITLLALLNKGPLAKVIYQPSIVYRTDYWHAGWKMTVSHPIFGVGIDSYGDWYRQLRGSISTLRGSVDRTANTAHNIFLDISSGGGFPLLITYLALLFFAINGARIYLRQTSRVDPLFIGVLCSWIAYQIQSLISINQIGVGIWGWLLSGILVGFGKLEKVKTSDFENENLKKSKRKSTKIKVTSLRPQTAIISFIFLIAGFILAYIPFKADVNFKQATQSRNFVQIRQVINQPGITAFHIENVLNTAIANNLGPQARDVAQKLTSDFPRDFMGWAAMSDLTINSPSEKAQAKEKLISLDPYNPNIRR